jgi:uncharacterized protein (TIGR00369 family)
MSDDEYLATVNAQFPPYARGLGMEAVDILDKAPLIRMGFDENVHGRPGYFHGGALSGLLEIAGFAALRMELRRTGTQVSFKPVNVSVEFLRGAVAAQPTVALGEVTRAGRRIANVSARAWQENRDKPVAEAWMNFLLSPLK